MKQGVKEVLAMPREVIEQRFALSGDEGMAWEFVGSCTGGLPGGAFIYPNKETLSVGIVVQLAALAQMRIKAADLLEGFKNHPAISRLLAGSRLVEYSAHLIPVAGVNMMPRLYRDGMLVAGDAAALVIGTGLILEGANLAIASGVEAARTIIKAKERGDFSAATLAEYEGSMKTSFVMKDFNTFGKAPHFLENERIYSTYPDLACEFAHKLFSSDGKPRRLSSPALKRIYEGQGLPMAGSRRSDSREARAMKIEDKLAVNKYDIDRDSHITIHEDVCRSCPDQPCLSACPAGCFSLVDGGILFSFEGCLECGSCRIVCAKGAIDWTLPRPGFGICYEYG